MWILWFEEFIRSVGPILYFKAMICSPRCSQNEKFIATNVLGVIRLVFLINWTPIYE